MFNISWLNIRAFNNSQNSAFEELVCQLANEEVIPGKVDFRRIGAPDGGVEAYCKLEDESEYGWQAKYFLTMGDSQWKQLEKSLKRAIDTHPNLVKYFVCIPLDRQDPRIPDQQWFMDKWNTKEKEWKAYASTLGRVVEFEYWGSSELLSRLAQEKNAGRMYFWFNKEEFSDEWFSEQLQSSIDSLGRRYTPELNFELDIAKHFDGLARNEKYQSQLMTLHHNFLIKIRKLYPELSGKEPSEYRTNLQMFSNETEKIYNEIEFSGAENINFSKLLYPLDQIRSLLSNFLSYLYTLKRPTSTSNAEQKSKEVIENKIYYLRQAEAALDDYYDFLNSPATELTNKPYLLIKGEAGIGKSHLLADICQHRQSNGELSLLLLGQHFVSMENPWTQIINNILRLQCGSESEFLGALNAKAESIGKRIVVFVDAINEGQGRYIWDEYLRNFVRSFEKYKWLGLVISIRSSYEDLLANESILPKEVVVRLTHFGFTDVEYAASKQFFQYFQIQQPSIPLLHPEFRNPLFLKLFCEGLNKGGHRSIPEGYEGISTIIGFFMKGINTRLSDARRLDYPNNINLVEKAANLIIQMRVETDHKILLYEDVYLRLEKLARQYNAKGQLLVSLISEGLLSCNLIWSGQEYVEGIYFTYERFEDYLTAKFLLDQYLNRDDPKQTFNQGNKLFEYVKDEHACYINKGIIEAFSVQLPEKIGLELYELAPFASGCLPFIESFIESLPWRKPETITDKIKEYINKYVIRYNRTNDLFLDTLLMLTSRPKHYFNAEFLHNHLMRFSLADRDAWWTVYIHQQYEGQTPVKRLIDWAWTDEDKRYISDEAILLSATTLSWFLTSSNRFLRDSATKALVSLLQTRINILMQLLKRFESVNDPYILERLYAVAYGCSLRTNELTDLTKLSEYIYTEFFDQEIVYPHILMRDYARGVIEYALHLGLKPMIDEKKIRPPYKSEWYDAIPTQSEIDALKFDYNSDNFKDHYWSQNAILNSMRIGKGGWYGDFGRYVFQSGFRPWRDLDIEDLSHLAIKRIFDLGYNVKKHGRFDRSVKQFFDGRRERKPERLGKKYQWIAFYELLAKVSDHFMLYDDSNWRQVKRKHFCGPWEPYVRDIDPTMLIKKTGTVNDSNQANSNWWFNISYNNWADTNESWVQKGDDLPDPKKMLIVKDPLGEEWIVLESYPQWTEPVKLGEEKWDYPRKRLWYQIRSYLVQLNRHKTFFNWISRQHFMGRWMPESESQYKMFSREYYWSPAFEFLQQPYYGGGEWQKVTDQNGVSKGNVMITTLNFLWEEPYDCSKTESISFLKPCKSIFTGMNMKLSTREGELLNEKNKLICLDPSVNHSGLSCLLVRKKDFVKYLHQNKLRIVWTMLGEKQVIGGTASAHYSNWLEVSGAFRYDMSKEEVQGSINKVLQSPI